MSEEVLNIQPHCHRITMYIVLNKTIKLKPVFVPIYTHTGLCEHTGEIMDNTGHDI